MGWDVSMGGEHSGVSSAYLGRGDSVNYLYCTAQCDLYW
jgi:hypothetical protein